MKKSLIFDLDGTLWDALETSVSGFNTYLSNNGINKKMTVKELKDVTGKPFKECIEIIFPGLIAKNSNILTELLLEEDKAILEKGGILYKNVKVGLKALSEKYDLFLISNCHTEYLEVFLDKSYTRDLFKDYDCNGMSKLEKYKMIKNMKKKHNLGNTIYIGDTLGDKEACIKSDTKFAYVSYGFGSIENEELKFNNFGELVEYFK